MAHSHSVYDSDPHFKIDAVTRAIANTESKKTMLIQNDHNSERFSFEIPRYIEGHDMSLSNKVEVHYANADANRVSVNAGVYEVTDMIVDPADDTRIVFTWLVSENATKYAGSLSFLVLFSCVEDGVSVYRWNTGINNSITIAKGMNNGEAVAESYPDILAQWKDELFAAASGNKLISVGPIEPDTYPYIWFDTSEFVGTSEKNVGYLTIKTGDGISQRLYPIVKIDSIDGLAEELDSIVQWQATADRDIDNLNTALEKEIQDRRNADALTDIRIDELLALLTSSTNAIAHSLVGKGVTVPEGMTIEEVAALIDSISVGTETSLQGIYITNPPYKTEYYVGEQFNNAGMVVTADFGNGVTLSTNSYSVTPAIMEEDTTRIIVSVTINGVTKTATYPITISASTLATVSAGSKILVPESDTDNAWYIVADTDYLDNVLLVREECLSSSVKYLESASSTAYVTKYEGSYLDNYLNSTFYGSLAEATASAIQTVNIPVRSSASAGAEQSYLSRNVFTLSATEWGLEGSSLEGEAVEYTDCRTLGFEYWTREPASGMTNFAYTVISTGDRGHGTCNVNYPVRPAFCISKNQLVTETDGGWALTEEIASANPSVLNDASTGVNYQLAVEDGSLSMTETTAGAASDFGILYDTVTGYMYKIEVVDGRLTMSTDSISEEEAASTVVDGDGNATITGAGFSVDDEGNAIIGSGA